jgi:protein O-mannosyl-transferase
MDRNGSPRQLAVLCALLVGVTLVTFWPVRYHEFINFDDPDYVTENDRVKQGLSWPGVEWAFTTGHASNWHPVTWLSHMLDVKLFGLDAGKHHLTNLLFHSANSVLVLLLLWQMTGAVWRSALVAALFALHPLHVESVAWVAERKDVLSTFFGLLTLMAYVRFVRQSQVPGLKAKIWYGIALGSFALGLMSKPMLVTWPFVMLLLDFWPLRRVTTVGWQNQAKNVATTHPTLSTTLSSTATEDGPVEAERASRTWKRLAMEKVPFLALVVGSCVVTFLVQHEGGTVTTGSNLPLGDRLENAVVSYVKYLGKMVWPTDLAIFYPHPETRYPMSEQWPWWLIGIAALFLVCISMLAVRQLRERPYIGIGWFWYLGTLVPVIGIVQVGTQAMADRYTYIPAIGMFITLVWYLGEIAARAPSGKLVMSAATSGILFVCLLITRTQLTYWRDSFSVFHHAVAVTRNNAPAHANLGTEYARRGEVEQARIHFQAALAADPSFADADCNLGLLAQNQGKLAESATYYRNALRINPNHVLAHNNLGTVLWRQGQSDEAELEFNLALLLQPDYVDANVNLGNLLLEQRRPLESESCFLAALRMRPGQVSARVGLGLALKMQGQLAEAVTQLGEAVRVEPQNLEAALNLGVMLNALGQTNEAAGYLQQVMQVKPGLSEELALSGETLAAQGKTAAAVDPLEAAVCLQPDNWENRKHLALLLAQTGKLDQAAKHYGIVLTEHPDADSHYYLAMIRALQGNAAGAVIHFQQAIKFKPDYLTAINELAWLLATHPDAKIRNGKEAVELAEQACKLSGGQEARYWGTLDAAYAEAGRFPEAIHTVEKARTLAVAAGEQSLADAAAARHALYLQNKPFRQSYRQ